MFGMHVHRDAAAIVRDGNRVAGFMQEHGNMIGEAVEVFIDRVIDDFPHEMVQAFCVRRTDVHGRPLADRFEALEDSDIGGGVPGRGGGGHGWIDKGLEKHNRQLQHHRDFR